MCQQALTAFLVSKVMKYEKGSFIVVPNKKSLEGLDAYTQVIYFWLCDFSDDDGTCWPSRALLAKKANVSLSTVDRSIARLEELELLKKFKRYYEQAPTTNLYQLMLVKGGSVLGTLGSVPQTTGVASEGRTELNIKRTQSINRGELEIRVESDKPLKEKKDTSYRSIFSLWGSDYPLHWNKNLTEIEAAKNLLKESSLEDVKWFLGVYEKYKAVPYCPTILKPSDVDRKWDNLLAFKKKHG